VKSCCFRMPLSAVGWWLLAQNKQNSVGGNRAHRKLPSLLSDVFPLTTLNEDVMSSA